MNEELIAGLVAIALPLFAVGYLMLRKEAGIFRMYIAMLLIGLGYLTATGAINDIGRKVLGRGEAGVPAAVPAAAKPIAAPAPAATPAPAPAATAPATPPASPMPPPAAAPAAPAPAPAR